MKIINILITDFMMDFLDVSQVGDPAPEWRKILQHVTASGHGFTSTGKEKVSVDVVLTIGEQDQLLGVCQRIEQRLIDDV